MTLELSPTSPTDDARALRRRLRALRRAVSPEDRAHAARRIAVFADALRLLRPGRRIALYLPLAEEIDTAPLMKRARARHCQVFLPRITDTRRNRMSFVSADGPWRRGRWGILEPVGTTRRAARELDVIFTPLVGFDSAGNRMGMGKGFYDRALAFRRRHPHRRHPLLVGLAFECQRVESLPVRPHDVPLDLLITERAPHRFLGTAPA
ncbi:5-formyltetrahydrofolate cyclo-ligase [bacterium]|nr:MAG: 5-formyltetrahydrofolate cyclo-ligase [bacterium]